jgi:PHP family Zn ribbon phosphoesterase
MKKVMDDELLGTCSYCCLTFTIKDWVRNKERCPNCGESWNKSHTKSISYWLENGSPDYVRPDTPENIVGGNY